MGNPRTEGRTESFSSCLSVSPRASCRNYALTIMELRLPSTRNEGRPLDLSSEGFPGQSSCAPIVEQEFH